MILPRKGLHIQRIWGPQGGERDNWSGCLVRGSSRDLVVITIYLKDGGGLSPTNLARLGQVQGLIKSLKVPWMMVGDFNMSPQTLQSSGLIDLLEGSIITADGGASTCTTGKGSLLDCGS